MSAWFLSTKQVLKLANKMYLLLKLHCSVVNRLVDSLLEEIGEQLESLGLDPLPIPDIRVPYSLDTVSEAVFT